MILVIFLTSLRQQTCICTRVLINYDVLYCVYSCFTSIRINIKHHSGRAVVKFVKKIYTCIMRTKTSYHDFKAKNVHKIIEI